jgi:predicted DNA-binding transcriptional regulator AlpA
MRKRRQKNERTAIDSPLLTTEEAAIYCHISRRGFYRHVLDVPPVRIGGRFFYKRKDLDRWIDAQTVPSRDYEPPASGRFLSAAARKNGLAAKRSKAEPARHRASRRG